MTGDLLVGGTRTRIESEGNGPPLILLHGLGGPLIWQRVSPLLAGSFRVITVHLPGFGESEGPVEPLTTEGAVSCVTALADLLGLENFSCCGTSWGGEVAARVAAAAPSRVSRLILVNSIGFDRASGRVMPPLLDRIVASKMFGNAASLILRSERLACLIGRRSFHDPALRPPGYCRDVHRQIMYERHRKSLTGALRSIAAEPSRAASIVASRSLPVLVVAAANDAILTHRAAPALLSGAPHARFELIPGCGHSLPLEKPEALADLLRRFLS